jgi:phosphoribosylglycinamide formyltransferase-1
MKHIAIFASGNGTNAEAIISHFQDDPDVSVSLIISNNPEAYVLQRAENHQIPFKVITRELFYHREEVLSLLEEKKIDLVVLAGFMWLVPGYLVQAYVNRMVNIHPALLPRYGGKGMYGMNVHRAVKEAGDNETGITIHWVNEHYDEGAIILQKACLIDENDSPEQIAAKVHALEYEYYPKVIESIVKNS